MFSLSFQVPHVNPYGEADCPLSEVGGLRSNGWTAYCFYGIDLPMTYFAQCHPWGPGSAPFPVLIAHTSTWLSTATLRYEKIDFDELGPPGANPPQYQVSVSQEAVVGFPFRPGEETGIMTLLTLRYGVPWGVTPPGSYIARDKTTTDIPVSVSLPQDFSYIQTHIGDGAALSSPNPADLLALLGTQSRVDLARVVSPVYNEAVHANHPACRGPDKIVTDEIPFTQTANFVSTPAGNENLIFASGLNEPALHYNAQQGITRGSGSILSDDGLSFIDLSQFTGSSLPIIDNLVEGHGVGAHSCLIAKPTQCTDVTLLRT